MTLPSTGTEMGSSVLLSMTGDRMHHEEWFPI